jgi:NAD(P)H dehydrogenase (quinone)
MMADTADMIELCRAVLAAKEALEKRDRVDPDRFDVQAEQRRVSETGTLAGHVVEELEHMDRADLLILQYPMWWHMPPAILKGWFDRVLAYGAAYTSSKRFENGRFVGKRAMLSVTVGTSRATYMHDGCSGDIDLMLWPVNFSLAYVGYTLAQHFVAYGVEAGLRYSDPAVIEARLKGIVEDFLPNIGQRPTIPFNRMAEWVGWPHRQWCAGVFAFRPPQATLRSGVIPAPAKAGHRRERGRRTCCSGAAR